MITSYVVCNAYHRPFCHVRETCTNAQVVYLEPSAMCDILYGCNHHWVCSIVYGGSVQCLWEVDMEATAVVCETAHCSRATELENSRYP